MWVLDCEEGWVLKNCCFWTVVLEKTLESSLDCKEIQPVHSEGDQPWDFFGGNDAKAETPVLWPPHAKTWLIGKDSDAGRDWGQEEKGMTEDEMAGWHHWLKGVWVNSGSWWWTGRPGVLLFMGSQRVGHDWATELNWTEGIFNNWLQNLTCQVIFKPCSSYLGFELGPLPPLPLHCPYLLPPHLRSHCPQALPLYPYLLIHFITIYWIFMSSLTI